MLAKKMQRAGSKSKLDAYTHAAQTRKFYLFCVAAIGMVLVFYNIMKLANPMQNALTPDQEAKYYLEEKIREEFFNESSNPDLIDGAKLWANFYGNPNRGNASMIIKPLLFLHVPKTGGSTLGNIFKRNEAPKKFMQVWAHPHLNEFHKILDKQTIFGHFRYGIHFYFNRSCTYLTMLRDPVDRVVSHYYYHRQRIKDPGHAFAANHTFEEWIRLSPSGENEQTRMISGIRTTEQRVSNLTLQIAKFHLRKFAFVGITERYHESLLMIKHIAGFKTIKYRATNKGMKRPKVKDVSPETIQLIKEYNWADIELYKYGLEIFERQMDYMPASFRKELDKFNEAWRNWP